MTVTVIGTETGSVIVSLKNQHRGRDRSQARLKHQLLQEQEEEQEGLLLTHTQRNR